MMESSPFALQQKLYHKYSSSQTYFYTNKINQIIKEKRTVVNIVYEDVQYLLDLEQNLKRWYQAKEFSNKLFTFKEYYFYHQDCPRIFMKGLEEAYAKWQDKKRDVVYKKLKLLYKESYSSDDSHMDDQKSQNYVATTHFLLEISDYNPFSKKYYLRVEARREKEKKKGDDDRKNQSKKDIECLNHELSQMLNDMSMLSDISTLSKSSPIKVEKDRQKIKMRNHLKQKSQDKSKSKSTNLSNSNSNSIVTFNFKKNKESVEKLKNARDPKKLVLKEVSKEKNKDCFPEGGRMSPKFHSNQGENNFLKSKSIFSVSSFGVINKNSDARNQISRRNDPLLINFDSKKLTIDGNRKYETEQKSDKKKSSQPKNIIIKTKSTSKLEQRASIDKLPSRESSVGRLNRNDEFTDKKMSQNNNFDFRTRNMKSEFAPSTKKPILSVKNPIEVPKGKRLLELRHW